MRKEYLFVKKKDDFCNNIEQFKNMLLSNSRIEFHDNQLQIGQQKLEYSISQDNVERNHEVMFFFCISGINDESEEQQLRALECADVLIRRIIEQYKIFYINTIWDDVSIYYGKVLYPKIVNIENLLIKIIYIFMIKNLGSKWVEQALPREVRESIQKTQDKNGDRVHNMLVDCLYSADFIQLGTFFFTNYARQQDCQKLIRKIKLIENQTKEKLNELIEQYEARSNWERYFSDKIDVENLEEKWSKLYRYRNKVAHSKNIDKEDYDNAMQLIQELESAFNGCLEHVNDITLTSEECEAVENVAGETIERNFVDEVTSGVCNEKLVYEPLRYTVMDKKFFLHGIDNNVGICRNLDYSGLTGAINTANTFVDRISSVDVNAGIKAIEPLTRYEEAINIQANVASNILADRFSVIDSNICVSAAEPLSKLGDVINIPANTTENILKDYSVATTIPSDILRNSALSTELIAKNNPLLSISESPLKTKLSEIDSITTRSPIVAKDSIFESSVQSDSVKSTKYSLYTDSNKNIKEKD